MRKRIQQAGLIVACIAIWAAVLLYYWVCLRQLEPEKMAKDVTADLVEKDNLLTKIKHDSVLLSAVFQGKVNSRQQEYLLQQPVYIYAYNNDSLVFWNNNSVLPTAPWDSLLNKTIIKEKSKGVFVRKSFEFVSKTGHNGDGHTKHIIVAYLPVKIVYPVSNGYLSNHFLANSLIPDSAVITNQKDTSAHCYPITLPSSDAFNPLTFYLNIPKNQIKPYTPGAPLLFLFFMAVSFTIATASRVFGIVKRRYGNRTAFLCYSLFIFILCVITSINKLPFNLELTPLFADKTYSSVEGLLPSLKPLLVALFYGLWELFVVLSYRSAFNTNWERLQGSGAVSFVVCLLGIGVIYGYSGLLTLIIKTLCGDSNVQLDVSKYANVTPISISFLLIILLLVVSHFVMVWLIYRLIDKVWKRRFYKYIVYVAVLLVGEFVMRITKVELSFLVLGLGLFVMNDLGWYPKRLRLIDNYLLVWCVMAALFSGVTTYYFMKVMEQKNLLQYATQLALASDADKDLIFVVKRNKQFVQDPRLLQYFEKNKDNSQNPKTIIKKIDSTYFKQFANDYTINYYLYNAKENYTLIDSEQAMRYKEFDQARHSTLDSHIHTQYLDPEDRHIYLYDTIYKPGQQIAGYVLIDMQKKVFGRSSILSTLLLPNTTNNEDVLYPNAIYQDGKLIYSSKDYNFAVNLPSNHRKDKNSYSFEGGYYILSYNAENNKQILVVNKHNIFLEIISLFSYYVYILFFLLIGYLLFKLLFSLMRLRLIRRIEFGFKNSIQILMPVMLLVSFIISALLAVNFMMSDYEGSTAETQNQQLVSSSRLILSYLNSTNYKLNAMFNKVSERDSFFNYINKIAKNERHDINIYDVQGSLITSSQPEIYQKEIFSHKIDPDAYNALAYEGKTLQIQKEKIGSLSYLSGYMPLMGSEGVIIGYLNIPFYNAVDANNNKISTLIIALTNSYAFMFLITAFISVAFSRRFTKVYDLILHQFEKIKLEKNELLKWPHDDEIGRLVAEYNKMVQKVEDSAKELANSERDAAWREMARQVAHEIKNPLNPLKLNIQYLQYQAQNETSPFAQKVKLLTAPLLEQIDNLAYIATQFSSFAKLPESQPERIDIPLFMEENMQVYEQDNRARVTLLCHASPLYIICDKSQLIRLVNNIVENAMQAMPGTREGVIAIEIGIEDGKAKLTFADNGIGIPNDVKEKIFSPYFTTKSSGTGLGLAMTKKMIELWGGTITFSSIDGEGTVFTILLPIAE